MSACIRPGTFCARHVMQIVSSPARLATPHETSRAHGAISMPSDIPRSFELCCRSVTSRELRRRPGSGGRLVSSMTGSLARWSSMCLLLLSYVPMKPCARGRPTCGRTVRQIRHGGRTWCFSAALCALRGCQRNSLSQYAGRGV
ncbi:hypothetical protein BD309DRAFT_949025 [Dichomitus squalens]|nr:hypothetical protein BD309DRAFT_949025 [Dichomitus squalens]